MSKVGKADIIKALQESYPNVAKKDVAAIVNEFIADIKDTVAAGTTVTIPGFGTFKSVPVAERQCINPQTGEKMTVEAHNRVSFKAGTDFKSLV